MGSQSASRLVVRLGIGLVQGLVLALLFLAIDHKVFPANVPELFAPLIVVTLFVPLLISQALGNLRRPTLIAWTIAASVIVAGLAWYDVWHSGPSPDFFALPVSLRALLSCAVFLFVGHALVSCGDADGRIVARYPTLFDLAWKLGAQIAIILCFVAAFWIMLRLGTALFDMIKLTGFGHLVQNPMVAIPLTTVAAAAALHATDTSAPLVRGVRTLALTMLGWLLPVIALIALAFLISLVVTGLQPLWATRTAALLLIATAAVLVIHINAAYQDGNPEQRPSHILRVAGTLASVLLVFLVWIAAYALWLRVTQYGWTVDRITSAGAVAVAGMFALGYLIAAVLPGPWLRFIERWNVYGTFFFLIVLLALATPIADPMRLSVADQVQRLKSGVVSPVDFDFDYLAHAGGRYGIDALKSLQKSPNKDISEWAAVAQVGPTVLAARNAEEIPSPTAREKLVNSVNVFPKGKTLPASFLAFVKADEKRNSFCTSARIPDGGMRCYPFLEDFAVVRDFDGDGIDDIFVVYRTDADVTQWSGKLFKADGSGWRPLGSIGGGGCRHERDALRAGAFEIVLPLQRDVVIAGQRFKMGPYEDSDGCR
jgi:hypothetical protein